jgi:hypothetical protein
MYICDEKYNQWLLVVIINRTGCTWKINKNIRYTEYQIATWRWEFVLLALWIHVSTACNILYIINTYCYITGIVSPKPHALIGWFVVTWHLTIKLFPTKSLWADNIAKSMMLNVDRQPSLHVNIAWLKVAWW